MSNVTIEAVAGAPEATVRRLIGEGHPLHDGGEGKLLETYWLPDNRTGSIQVRTNRGGPARKALIHLARNGDPDFYLVAAPDELERMISQHSEAQIDGLAAAAPTRAVNPLDEECEACQ